LKQEVEKKTIIPSPGIYIYIFHTPLFLA
jgi:hypothetical protein